MLKSFLSRQAVAGCTHVVLHRATHAGVGPKVEKFKLDPETVVAELAETIEQSAQDDCDTINQIQLYAVRAMKGENVEGQFSMSRTPDGEAEGEGYRPPATEAPTKDGLVTQLMRHIENKERQNAALMSEISTVMSRQGDMFERILGTLREGYAEGLQARAELATKSASRENEMELRAMELEAEQRAKARKDDMIQEGIKLFAPFVLEKLAKLDAFKTEAKEAPKEPEATPVKVEVLTDGN